MNTINIAIFILLIVSVVPWCVVMPIITIYKSRQARYWEQRFKREQEHCSRLLGLESRNRWLQDEVDNLRREIERLYRRIQ